MYSPTFLTERAPPDWQLQNWRCAGELEQFDFLGFQLGFAYPLKSQLDLHVSYVISKLFSNNENGKQKWKHK